MYSERNGTSVLVTFFDMSLLVLAIELHESLNEPDDAVLFQK